MKKISKGFTLIELLVVIAIIALLAALILASLTKSRSLARDARRISDIRQIQNALDLYASNNNYTYPPASTVTSAPPNALVPTYISTIPKDPRTGVNYGYAALNNQVLANNTGPCVGYHLVTLLENTNTVLGSDADALGTDRVCALNGATNVTGVDTAVLFLYDVKK